MLPPSYVSGLCAIRDNSASPIWVTGLPRKKRSPSRSGVQQPCQRRYELHEPPVPTSRLELWGHRWLNCEDDKVAAPMPALHGLGIGDRNRVVQKFTEQLAGS